MIRKNILQNFSGLAIIFSFIGCGGEGSLTTNLVRTTSTKNTIPPTNTSVPPKGFNYAAELSKAPQIIQDAMNSQPVQYIDENFLKSLGKKPYSAKTISMVATPTIKGNQGYSFITIKVDDKVIVETVYAWQKDIALYSVASRQMILNDPNDDPLIVINDFLCELEEKRSASIAKGLPDLLSLSIITLNGTAKFIGETIFFTNVNYTVHGQTKPLKGFKISNDGLAAFVILFEIYNDFSKH